jgi:tRNA(adenine34) deaminase
LAKSSIDVGEYPFAAVITRNGSFFCESINKLRRNHDVNRHAEIAAFSKTQTVEQQIYSKFSA